MFRIITTLGPSTLEASTLRELEALGVCDFRINLSHCSNSESYDKYFDLVKTQGLKPSIDTQGAQARVVNQKSIKLKKNNLYTLMDFCVDSINSTTNLVLSHRGLTEQLQEGDILKLGFDGISGTIIKSTKQDPLYGTKIKIDHGGILSPNKAIDVHRKNLIIPCLSEFDIEILTNLKGSEVKNVFLSFCNSLTLIDNVRKIISKIDGSSHIEIISKIENLEGVDNICEIARESDGVLIDRGDLSREVSLSKMHIVIDSIIAVCKMYRTPCYIATDIFDSMIAGSTIPTRSEVSDLFTMFDKGISGIVLAAEVAIGKYPIECVKIARHLRQAYESSDKYLNDKIKCTRNDYSLPDYILNWL